MKGLEDVCPPRAAIEATQGREEIRESKGEEEEEGDVDGKEMIPKGQTLPRRETETSGSSKKSAQNITFFVH